MLIRRFKREHHDDYGEDGWLMVGAPSTYEPIFGSGLAHDVMEHQAKDDGSVEHELLALGASLYVRGEGFYWEKQGNINPPGVHLGSDIGGDLAIKYEGIERGIANPGRTVRLEPHAEVWIAQAVNYTRSLIKDALDDMDYSPWTTKQIEEYVQRVPGWLRRGYRMAAQRYKGISSYTLLSLYEQIANKAAILLKDDMSEYCELVVQLNIRKRSVLVYLDESGLDLSGD